MSDLTRAACDKAPIGWRCSRNAGHEGPCAAHYDEDRLVEFVAEAIEPHLPAYMTMTSARKFARAAVEAFKQAEVF